MKNNNSQKMDVNFAMRKNLKFLKIRISIQMEWITNWLSTLPITIYFKTLLIILFEIIILYIIIIVIKCNNYVIPKFV